MFWKKVSVSISRLPLTCISLFRSSPTQDTHGSDVIFSHEFLDDFDQLQQIQRNNHASNEEQIMLEKARQKKARDDKRRFKAASRATTPSGLRSPSSMYGGPSLATTRPGSIIGISPQTATLRRGSMQIAPEVPMRLRGSVDSDRTSRSFGATS